MRIKKTLTRIWKMNSIIKVINLLINTRFGLKIEIKMILLIGIS